MADLFFGHLKDFSRALKAFVVTQFFFYAQKAVFKFLINVYFLRITDDIGFLVLYNVIFYAAHWLAYFPAGKLAEERNRFLPIRIGMIVQLIFLVWVLLLGEDVVTFIIPVAILGGVANGFYWTSGNLMRADLTSVKNRLRFTTVRKITKNGIEIFLPFLAAVLVVANGDFISSYSRIFIVAAALTAGGVVSTFFISRKGILGKGRFHPLRAVKKFFGDVNIRLAYASSFFDGMFGLSGTVVGLLLVFRTGTELSWGGYSMITAIVAVGANFLVGRYFSRRNYRQLLIFSGVADFAVIFIFFLSQDFGAVVIYGIASVIFSALRSPYHPLTQDTFSAHCKTKEEYVGWRVEFVLWREFFIVGGLVAGFLLLLLLENFQQFWLVAGVLVVLGLARLLANVLLTRVKEGRHVEVDGMN